MTEYKDGRDNTSRGRGGIFFRGRGSSTRSRVFSRGQDNFQSVLVAIEPITILTDVGSCMANLSSLLELLICLVLLDHILHITLILLVFSLMTLSKSEYDYLIQKMHSVSTSDIATLAYLGISCLASSSLSSWIIDSSVSAHVIGNS